MVSNFTLATHHRVKGGNGWKDETDWHNIALWRSENLARYLLKGRQVLVEGRLHTSSWQGDNGKRQSRVEVIAENVAAEMAYSDMPPLASRVASIAEICKSCKLRRAQNGFSGTANFRSRKFGQITLASFTHGSFNFEADLAEG